MHYPDFDTFKRLAEGVDLLPVYRRLVADSLTPVSAFHRLDLGPCACLFESVVGGEKVGRYSFLTADPFMQVEARGPQIMVTTPAGVESFESDDPLAELKRRLAVLRAAHLPELPPFTGGRGRLCRLRRGALRRELAERPGRRSSFARPCVRIFRSDGGVRPHQQDDRGGGTRAAR